MQHFISSGILAANMADSSIVLESAAKSAVYTIVIQGVFRLLTFVMNSVMLHHITRDLLGVANVRCAVQLVLLTSNLVLLNLISAAFALYKLVLLNQTIIFLTCEAFRRACLSKVSNRCWTQSINLLWFILPVGIMWSCICGFLWLYVWQQPEPAVVPFYETSVYWFCISSFVEILVQPVAVVGQILLFVEVKAVIEGISLLLRCLLTVTFVVCYPQLGLKSFCYAQLLYAGLMLVMYYSYFISKTPKEKHLKTDFPFNSVQDFLPKATPGKSFVCGEMLWLVGSFFLQSFLKYFLTEGEKIVMTVLGIVSFADQGVYDVISNLGSLPARMIFLPVEDALYLFFTKTLHRGQPAVLQQQDLVQLVSRVLESSLKVSVLIGLVFITFGYSYSFLLLSIYGGPVLTDGSGPFLLRWYCAYVLLNAMNGVTEGFKNATMSDSQVNQFSQIMILLTAVTIFSSWFLTVQFGSVGLIWANTINMLLRILHSVYYIRKFYANSKYHPHYALMPCWPVVFSFISVAFITATSERWLCCGQRWLSVILHVGVGAFCLLTVSAVIYLCERQLIASIQTEIWPFLRRQKPSIKDKEL